MSSTTKTLLCAAGMGAIAGIRSMSAPALLSRRLSQRQERSQGYITRLLSSRRTANTLTLLAAGEMVADKTSFIPDRTEAISLIGRALMGAVSGAAVASARDHSKLGAALVGSAVAAGSTALVYTLRKQVEKRTRLPDSVLGLIEDATVLIAGQRLVSAVEQRPDTGILGNSYLGGNLIRFRG